MDKYFDQDPIIKMKNIHKSFGDKEVLKGVDFDLHKCEVHALLGENGAGKTTTMNIITGYIGATSGSVKVCGHDIFKEPIAAKKEIGYLPEIPPSSGEQTYILQIVFSSSYPGPDSFRIPRSHEKPAFSSHFFESQIRQTVFSVPPS